MSVNVNCENVLPYSITSTFSQACRYEHGKVACKADQLVTNVDYEIGLRCYFASVVNINGFGSIEITPTNIFQSTAGVNVDSTNYVLIDSTLDTGYEQTYGAVQIVSINESSDFDINTAYNALDSQGIMMDGSSLAKILFFFLKYDVAAAYSLSIRFNQNVLSFDNTDGLHMRNTACVGSSLCSAYNSGGTNKRSGDTFQF